MSLSATEAAFEGFRVVRRKPTVVAWWALAYLVLFAVAFALAGPSLIEVMTIADTMNAANPSPADMQRLGAAYAGLAWLLPAGLLFGAVLNTAIVRAVLRPEEGRLGYLRLGQPATELSGGEAQRVKLASELQRSQRGDTLYVLDEPTSGLHCADSDRLVAHLQTLVDAGNTVVAVELDMRVVAAADHVVDLGPGAGDDGGTVVTSGTPAQVASSGVGASAPYLEAALQKAASLG